MRKIFLCGLLLSGLLALMPVYADTITLLNGNTVEGKITERTDKYLKIETEGLILTYYADEIKYIHQTNKHDEAPKIENFKTNFKAGIWSMAMITQMDGLPPEAAEAMDRISPEMKQEITDKMKDQMKKKGMDLLSFDIQGTTMTMTMCMKKQAPIPFNMNNAMYNSFCHENHEIDGNTFHFSSTCAIGTGSMFSSGYMTYNNDSMEGEIKSQSNMMNRTMTSTVHMTGKYLGPCA